MAWIRCTGNTGGSLKVRTASGRIATFETNMADVLQEVKCEINAKQDLHGENNPYPAGGGVNLFDKAFELGCRWEGDGSFSSGMSNKNAGCPDKIPCKPNTTYAFVINNISQTTYMYLSEFDVNENHIQKGSSNSINTSTKYVTFTTGANTYFVAFSLYANAEFTSAEVSETGVNYPATVHDYHPYENICPIEGFTEANITRCGVNLFDISNINDTHGSNTLSINGDEITITWVNGATIFTTKDKQTFPAGNYIIKGFGTNTNKVRAFFYNASDNTQLTSVYINVGSVITLTADFYIAIGGKYDDLDTATFTLQLEADSIAHDYSPYNGQTYTIAFGQTVYGGVIDVTRGKLHVTHEEVDLGSLDWYAGSCNIAGKYTMRSDGISSIVKKPPTSSIAADILCEVYTKQTGDAVYLGNTGISILGASGSISVFDDDYSASTSPTDFKSAMSGKIVVYPLATPFDIDLTPRQIEALLGINNVWHDGNGDTEVKYLEVVRN